MQRQELVAYLDAYLQMDEFADYGPQGLQVEAPNEQIERLALAVDVAPAVIVKAAEWQADMLLVHHGILWRDVKPIAGPLGKRIRLLLRNDISLYAAHLALDAHPEVGNNVVLARMLQVSVAGWWCAPKGMPIAVYGSVADGTMLDQFVGRVEKELETTARVLEYGPSSIRNVAIVSGFGADQVESAKLLGADTLVTGETSHANFWLASDYGMNIIYGGHYATETVGVKALGEHLAHKHGLEIRFFDFPTAM